MRQSGKSRFGGCFPTNTSIYTKREAVRLQMAGQQRENAILGISNPRIRVFSRTILAAVSGNHAAESSGNAVLRARSKNNSNARIRCTSAGTDTDGGGAAADGSTSATRRFRLLWHKSESDAFLLGKIPIYHTADRRRGQPKARKDRPPVQNNGLPGHRDPAKNAHGAATQGTSSGNESKAERVSGAHHSV